MAELKNTPLREFHLEMGAKMVPRSGWNLPLNFSEGAADEHECCREKAALFDFCADARLRMAFPGAREALEQLLADKDFKRPVGSCRKELLTDDEGNGAAFLRVSLMAEDDLFITVPFQSAGRVRNIFSSRGLEYADLSEYLCCIGIAGPESRQTLAACGISEEELPRKGETRLLELDGLRAIVSFSDELAEEGYELNFNAECADQIWDLLLETDIPWPAGLAAQESLRIENSSFSASELMIPRKAATLFSSLGRVVFSGRRAPFAGVKVKDASGAERGVVTAGAYCPALGAGAAVVYFTEELPSSETELFCDASGVEVTGFLR